MKFEIGDHVIFLGWPVYMHIEWSELNAGDECEVTGVSYYESGFYIEVDKTPFKFWDTGRMEKTCYRIPESLFRKLDN